MWYRKVWSYTLVKLWDYSFTFPFCFTLIEVGSENCSLDDNSKDAEVNFQSSRQKQLREAAKSLMNAPDPFKDEDYDTDLEEDFPKGKKN